MSPAREFGQLEGLLGYQFTHEELLERALTHRSFANESRSGGGNNEKLEFLGDAVLDLVVGHLLMDQHPSLSEGELSVTRAQVVSEAGLSEVAGEMGLGAFLRLGRGEERSGGREKPSLLADALEAVVAAVYVDGGFDAARALVERLLSRRLAEIDSSGFSDFKTRLQESAQAKLKATPEYRVVGESGPDHDKTFEVAVFLNEREWARAAGKSKKEAEMRAAAMAAFLLDGADLDGQPT
ncbi:MAG TPA: ribonuclease III [Kofleriaceae bacterium]|nr:ribonuclease III [Kofleriaceae bacterium]